MKWLIKLGTIIALGSNLVVSKKHAFPFHFPKVIVFYIGVWIMAVGYIPILFFRRPKGIVPIVAYLGAALVSSLKGGKRAMWSDMHRMDGWISMAHHAAFGVIAKELSVDWLMKVNVIVGSIYAGWELTYSLEPKDRFSEKKPMDNALYSSAYILCVAFHAMELAKKDKKWTYCLVPMLLNLLKHKKVSPTTGFLVGIIGPITLLGLPLLPWLLKRHKFNARLEGWKVGIKGFKDKPIWGWGLDNFYYVFQQYADENFYNTRAKWFDKAHNKYVSILTEQGIAGAVTFGWLTIDTFRHLEQKWLRRGLIAYMVNSITNIDTNLSHIQYWLFVACSRRSEKL